MKDVLIIGAGAAGMTAALYALRNGKSVTIVEQNNIGGQIAESPRVENFPTIMQIAGADFADQLFEQITQKGADFAFAKITKLEKKQGYFEAHSEFENFQAKSVIIACGVEHRKLGLENEEELIGHGISYCALCDGAFYAGEDVVLIGDANTALQVPGIKIVAVCDLYDARLEQAKKQWGDHIFVTKDYKDILSRKDVDAVLIGTPDHWHQPIAIAAMKAGKHVYCEKPVIHKISEAEALIDAQKVSGMYFQAGSQGMASLGNRKARQLVQSGIIGKVNFIDGQFTGGPGTLGRYPVPEDASEETIWWKQFLGNAPKHKFEPQRFFYWRTNL